MRYILVLLIALLPPLAAADTIDFEWDYDTTYTIDGFNLYSGIVTQNGAGEWITEYGDTPLIEGINPVERSAAADVPGIPNVIQKYCFKMRAFRGDELSEDSNEICTKINNTPLLAPENLQGKYEKTEKMITLEWSQPEVGRIKFWNIYYKIDGDDYQELGRVDNIGQQILSLTTPFAAVGDGQSKDVTFVVVAYKDYSVYSGNSAEVVLTVDKSEDVPVTPVENFRFKLGINVQ